MATNYDDKRTKGFVTSEFANADLPADIAAKILKSLGRSVVLNEVTATDANDSANVHGKDIVLVTSGGEVDLSGISKADLKGVDAFVFTTNDDVTFTLDGTNTGSFKGVVSTNAGNDTIVVNEENGKLGVTISSGDGDDSVTTGAGNDTVKLGSGADTVETGNGKDSVTTGLGDDSVSTGAGNDTVYVGAGNDSVDTGIGADIVKLAAGFIGNAQLDGGTDAGKNSPKDTLDLRLVLIESVDDVSAAGDMTEFNITLDDGSVINAKNFEKFIYDSSTPDVDGTIKVVGAHDFMNGFGGHEGV